jgi:large repetitive protein
MISLLRSKCSLNFFITGLLFFFLTVPGLAFAVDNPLLNVTVTDGISHMALGNQDVTVYRRESDGSLKWFRRLATDANGKLTLDLPGLGIDSFYVLRTKMKHGNRTADSSDIKQTGNFAFKAGNVRVKVLNGQNASVLGGYQINVDKIMANGSEVYFSHTNTDNNGLADFDLPELGNDQRYVFKAKSTFDNSWRTGPLISQGGSTTFVVGNPLLNVTVTDGISNTALGNQDLTVYRREADGSLKWFRRLATDVNGKLTLDLPGLGTDSVYVLRTKMKHGNLTADSSDIKQTGNFAFKAGNVRVNVVNGQTGSVLGGYQINALKLMANGSEVYFSHTNTDNNGLADFDLPELGNDQRYVFKAKSTFDNSWRTSAPINQGGLTAFVVGNQLLNVTVTDGISNIALSNQAVTLLRRELDGSVKGIRTVSTDAEGKLSLDLPGLGTDTVYVLRTAMKHGNRTADSSDIKQTGNFAFKAGNVRVKVINGQTDSVLVGQKVDVRKLMADGSDVYFNNTSTDSNGLADFNLPDLSATQAYIFKAQNSFDNSWKTSAPITQGGLTTFVVGNQLLNVTVTDGISNIALGNQGVTILRREAGGSLKWFGQGTTDANGKLALDLPGLGTDTVYVLRTAMKHGNRTADSSDIKQTGNFAFKAGNVRVKVINGQTGSVLVGQKVDVRKLMADGSDVYFNNTSTDSNGLADFNLPDLSATQAYIFKAQNSFDNSWKTSAPITQGGLTTFVVGNQLLNVTVTDGISNIALGNQGVTILRREAGGSLKWFGQGTTDANGKLALDLPGLGTDTVYVLRTAMKHGNRTADSSDIKQTGNFAFKAGNVRVKVINGQTGSVLVGQKVDVRKLMADGSDVYFNNTSTDSNGLADFNLPDLSATQAYIFKAQNSFDNSWKTSAPITQGGLTTFVVGNQLLNVTVTDGVNNSPLANQIITVLRRESDGSLKGLRTESTDVNGKLSLDLPGLGSDSVYVLRTQQLFGSGTVDSGEITNTGTMEFRVGNLLVKVINGATNQPSVGQDITVMEELVDGSLSWLARVPTDQNGGIPFHLPGLGQGRKYILRAQTQLDKRWISSDLIVNTGKFDFTVGNQLLNVTVLNALDGKPLANKEVTAFERLPDQTLRWFQRKNTDAQGRIDFDLNGLGKGSSYVLKANPYGSWIESKDLDKTGPFQLLAGPVAVKLHKAETGEVMSGQSLTLFEKGADGRLIWRSTLVTDSTGVVRFDPVGLGDGRLFVVRATNLFGNAKHHYSRWIAQKGWVDFAVDKDDSDKLDDEPPVFVAFNPSGNAKLSDKGFQLTMRVTDNQDVDRVEIKVTDPVAGAFSGVAGLVQGEWQFTVNDAMLTAGQLVTVKATAFDKVGNQSEIAKTYSIIDDKEAPSIVISSHGDEDQVDEHGLALLGSVFDNTGVKTLKATVIDAGKGTIESNKALELGENGGWGLAVRGLTRNGTVNVELVAEDWAGNKTHKTLVLNVMTESVSAVQLLNRITFGATPELLKEIRDSGSAAFIHKQLNPELIDDAEFESYLPRVLDLTPHGSIKLQFAQIARASSSKKQLLEVMTWFWENHFSTDLSKTAVDYELAENNGFRKHALGRFRDLLEVSAKSPAMLLYLDNHQSLKTAPNENYARELLELHTLGVDNGYSGKDIAEVARVFTGWRVANRTFEFVAWNHDNREKIVLGNLVPTGLGLDGGKQVLDILASHQGTARNICTKLLKLLVADQPSSASIVSCSEDFVNYAEDEDQIARVLEGILTSTAFSDSGNFHNKVKIPLELISGLFRQFPISIGYPSTRDLLREMGMDLFNYPVPTGWAEEADRWVNSGQLMQRWQFTGQAMMNAPATWRNYWENPAQFFIEQGIETAEGVVGYLFELTLSHDYSNTEKEAAMAILTGNGSEKFYIRDTSADVKIRKVLALVLNYPAYQLQ